MTLQQLKNQILLALYEQYKNDDIQPIVFDDFCSKHAIIYDTKKQFADAVRDLNSQALVKAIFFPNDNGRFILITTKGVKKVEEDLLTEAELITDGLNDTDKAMKAGYQIDIESNASDNQKTNSEHSESPIEIYYTQENYKEYKDSSPCFGIDQLAECYIQQLDKISKHTNDNFCMLGIFGPWGRGKTYFFQRVKKRITERQKTRNFKSYLLKLINKKKVITKIAVKLTKKKDPQKEVQEDNVKSSHIRYKIIEFNAWKYQDTPAIWAYLYETIYKQGFSILERRLFDYIYILNHHWLQIISIIFCFGIICILYNCILSLETVPQIIRSVMNALKIPLSVFVPISGVLYTILKNPFSLIESIEKNLKKKSYKGMLGVQNDFEQDLQLLIETIILRPQKEQIILYVDDIDRCDTVKMIKVVNALRLILENKEIQKSMIVICSIDVNKFIDAYCTIKYPQIEITDIHLSEAKLHLDKLFLFSIGLPNIDSSQQVEYLHTLYEEHPSETLINTLRKPFSVRRVDGSFAYLTYKQKIYRLTECNIGNFLGKYLEENQIKDITPRKIRILFYRLLFANNIIAAGEGLITETVMKKIINQSINDSYANIDSNSAYSDVINMVVPY